MRDKEDLQASMYLQDLMDLQDLKDMMDLHALMDLKDLMEPVADLEILERGCARADVSPLAIRLATFTPLR